MANTPVPLPYHRALVAHFQSAEPALWNWFTSSRKRTQEAEAVRLDLLKTTYRLEPQAQPRLHELANEVRTSMELSCSVSLYQAQNSTTLNAGLAFLPEEAHIILTGPLANVLSEIELRAVLAHELAHYLLFEIQQGEFLIANDLLRALTADSAAGHVAFESLRLYSLWTEIFADRWACHITGDLLGTIAALIKVETGLLEVSAESYLRQADEIFSKDDARTEHVSHPETYIRARALRLWSELGDDAQPEIERMIEGPGLNLQRLDLLGQSRAGKLTRRLLNSLLQPEWFRTEATLAHAKQFFPDFAVEPGTTPDDTSQAELAKSDASTRDYVCYLLLDFATADRELGDVALSAGIVLSRKLGINERFAELAQKELTLGKKAYARIDKNAETLLEKTKAAHTS